MIRGIVLLFSRNSALDGVGGSSPTPPTASNPRKDPVPIVQEADWAPGSVWTGAENLETLPKGIQSPDRPARNQSLYRLSYTNQNFNLELNPICHLLAL